RLVVVAEQVWARATRVPLYREVQRHGMLLALRRGEFPLKDENGVLGGPVLRPLGWPPSGSGGLPGPLQPFVGGGQPLLDLLNRHGCAAPSACPAGRPARDRSEHFTRLPFEGQAGCHWGSLKRG